MIYVIWTIITFVLSITGIVEFKPFYPADDMATPLLTDITTIAIFLPSYFILVWFIIHLIYIFVVNQRIKMISSILLLVGGFTISLYFLDFYSIPIKIMASLMAMLITFIYFLITTFLFKRSKLSKKQRNRVGGKIE